MLLTFCRINILSRKLCIEAQRVHIHCMSFNSGTLACLQHWLKKAVAWGDDRIWRPTSVHHHSHILDLLTCLTSARDLPMVKICCFIISILIVISICIIVIINITFEISFQSFKIDIVIIKLCITKCLLDFCDKDSADIGETTWMKWPTLTWIACSMHLKNGMLEKWMTIFTN